MTAQARIGEGVPPPPLGGRARVGGRRRERGMNRGEHDVDRGDDIAVRKAQHVKTLGSEILVPALVAPAFGLEPVLLAVDFDDELSGEAAEIRNIWPDRDLPPEMCSFERQPMPEMPPQPLLWLGHRAPKRLGAALACRRRAGLESFASPRHSGPSGKRTLSLPPRGEGPRMGGGPLGTARYGKGEASKTPRRRPILQRSRSGTPPTPNPSPRGGGECGRWRWLI